MNKKLYLFLVAVFLIFAAMLTIFLVGIFGDKTTEQPAATQASSTTEPTNPPATVVVEEGKEISLSMGKTELVVLSGEDENKLVKWTSNNPDIVTVDSGGKIDAISQGSGSITAVFSDNREVTYSVTVTEEEPFIYDGYSTCILANQDILEENHANFINLGRNLYYLKVNRSQNCVTAYTFDENGEYTIPVRAMISSCGLNNGTITGDFSIYFRNEWHALYGDVYGHYVSGISGDYLFHSVPFYYPQSDMLELEEFNKLGVDASLGCVRMETADVKWIYENCPPGTGVTIYDDDNPGPLGKPEPIRITDFSIGWDPTDDNESNPYKDMKPEITGMKDCTVKKGESYNPLSGVTAKDTCGNDITKSIVMTGNVVTSRVGTYSVTYEVEDVMHRLDKETITVTVTE